MSARFEVPFSPRPGEPVGRRMDPPWVPIEPRWEYKEMVREGAAGELPSEAELNRLGDEGWELAGVAPDATGLHFYFKRERVR